MIEDKIYSQTNVIFGRYFPKYDIVCEIDKGSYGTVYKVIDTETKIHYAAKTIYIDSTCYEGNQIKIPEVEILRQLSHPNILKYIDSRLIRLGLCFVLIIITQYCSNGSLYTYIENPKIQNFETSMKIVKQIISGLSYLHNKDIAHCDIKPGNILLDSEFNPVLADFGFSHKNITTSEWKFGTIGYAAPEIYVSNTLFTLKHLDIYALGHVIYQVFTGKSLWTNYNVDQICLQTINGDLNFICPIDCRLKKLVEKCTSIEPSKRPTIEEIIEDDFFRHSNCFNLQDNKDYLHIVENKVVHISLEQNEDDIKKNEEFQRLLDYSTKHETFAFDQQSKRKYRNNLLKSMKKAKRKAKMKSKKSRPKVAKFDPEDCDW